MAVGFEGVGIVDLQAVVAIVGGREASPDDNMALASIRADRSQAKGQSCGSTTVTSVSRPVRRSRFLQSAGAMLLTLGFAPVPAFAGRRDLTAALALTARNTGRRYFGDRALFATVSPGVPGRDTAAVRFSLSRRATVTLEAVRTAKRATSVAWQTTARLAPGTHELTWTPEPATPSAPT